MSASIIVGDVAPRCSCVAIVLDKRGGENKAGFNLVTYGVTPLGTISPLYTRYRKPQIAETVVTDLPLKLTVPVWLPFDVAEYLGKPSLNQLVSKFPNVFMADQI
jgi:hypothetical protein